MNIHRSALDMNPEAPDALHKVEDAVGHHNEIRLLPGLCRLESQPLGCVALSHILSESLFRELRLGGIAL